MSTGGYLSSRYEREHEEKLQEIVNEDHRAGIISAYEWDSLNEFLLDEGQVLNRKANAGEIPLSVLNTLYEIKKLFDYIMVRERKARDMQEGGVLDAALKKVIEAYAAIKKHYPADLINPLQR